MSYVDAGYSIGLGILFLYAVALVLRRRRWERAMRVAEVAEDADHVELASKHTEHRARRGAGCPRRTVVTDTINEPNPFPGPSTDADRTGPALPRVRRRSSKRLWLVFAVLLAAFVFLLVEGLGSSLNFFDTVDQAFAHRATLGTRTFNLEGDVVAGSIQPDRGGDRLHHFRGQEPRGGGQHREPAPAVPGRDRRGGGRALHLDRLP